MKFIIISLLRVSGSLMVHMRFEQGWKKMMMIIENVINGFLKTNAAGLIICRSSVNVFRCHACTFVHVSDSILYVNMGSRWQCHMHEALDVDITLHTIRNLISFRTEDIQTF